MTNVIVGAGAVLALIVILIGAERLSLLLR